MSEQPHRYNMPSEEAASTYEAWLKRQPPSDLRAMLEDPETDEDSRAFIQDWLGGRAVVSKAVEPFVRYLEDRPALEPQKSGDIVIAAPMSLAGSAERIWKITRNHEGWREAAFTVLALTGIVLAWSVVICWYLVFGLLLVPYRIIRRGQRKRHLAEVRHAELLAELGKRNGA